jgi:hypothetical protein
MKSEILGLMCVVATSVGCGPTADHAAPTTPPVPTASVQLQYDEHAIGENDFPRGAVAGGGMLAMVADIESGPFGRVYVLDSKFKKVSIFENSGELHQVVLGGFGHGPGEFQLPTTMAVADDGQIVVFDYALSRLTMFNTAGTSAR